MEIFGIGGFEAALVIIIALIVAGPARMAVWARTLGRWVAKLRQMWSVTAAQLQRELDDAGVDFKIPKDIPTRKAIVDELSRSSTVRELTKPIDDVKAALAESETAVREAQTGMSDVVGALTSGSRRTPVRPPQVKPNPSPASSVVADFGTWGTGASSDSAQTAEAKSDLSTLPVPNDPKD